MTTAGSTPAPTSLLSSSSSAEIAQQIKLLLQEKTKKQTRNSNSNDNERADSARLDELRRLFAYLVQRGDLEWQQQHLLVGTSSSITKSRVNSNEITKKWNDHLVQQHKKMVSQLCHRIQQGKSTAMRTMWGVLASSPKTIKFVSETVAYTEKDHQQRQQLQRNVSILNFGLVTQWIRAVVSQQQQASPSATTMMTMQMEFLQPYLDVQYQALQAITQLALEQLHSADAKKKKQKKNQAEHEESGNSSTSKAVPERLVQLLLLIPTPKTQEEMNDAQYLFPPPPPSTQRSGLALGEQDDGSNKEKNDDDSGDDDSQESSNDSDIESDDDGRVTNSRPSKRMKKDTSSNTTSCGQWNVTQARYHRRALARAWLAVLQLELPVSALKQVLLHLPTHVLPLVAQPLRFSDFLLQAYDSHQQESGMISILALEGLFILITQHGLEYANFYQQLYRLIATPQLFQVKFRTRFLQLLDKCLSRNDKLPSQIVASFIKRLCRTALLIPPASILFVLALCSNLLRQHQECAGLIHRSIPATVANQTTKTEGVTNVNDNDSRQYDVFDAATNDPYQTHALQSSLWELHALERHYHPAVATMAQAIGRLENNGSNSFKNNKHQTPLYDLSDFVRLTYQGLLEQEHQHAATQRKKKKTVPLTFVPPTTLLNLSSNSIGSGSGSTSGRGGTDVFAALFSTRVN